MATIAEILARSIGPARPPPPNYEPNFDAANPDPAEPPQLQPLGRGYVMPAYTPREQDQNAVEAAASNYRLSHQMRPPEGQGLAYDLANAVTGSPTLAGVADFFAPQPPRSGLEAGLMVGMAGKPRIGPKFVGPPPETDRARLTNFYNTAADQMALDPRDRFQPDPSHQVIDTNYQTPPPFVGPPQDLSQLYARHPDPTAALPTKDRARFFTDPVRKEAIAQKLVEKIQASGVMNSDARYFYGSAGPLFRAARKAGLTLDAAMAWIRDFGGITGATSPRTEVIPNVRNATSVMAKEAAGIPHREILGPGTVTKTGEKGISEKGYPMMTGEGAGGLHGQLIDDVLSGRGINPLTNTKPAVFEKQVGQGNLSGVTADTHIVRGAVMTANELYPGQIPIDWIKPEARAAYRANPSRLTADMVDDSLGSQMVDGQKMQTEFPVIADLYHRAAEILKVDPAEAQAMGWFGMGGETNLGSQLETVAKVLNDRISVTAQALGKTPEWVAEQVFRRRIPVMGLLGTAGAGAAAVGAAGQPQQPPGGT